MSLKGFHILFITVSVMLGLTMGLWGLREHRAAGNGGGYLGLGISALVLAAGLLVYGVWFLRKTRDLAGE